MSEYVISVESDDDELFTDIANMYGEVRSIGEEIVRCRDCKNYLDGWCMFENGNGDYLRMRKEPEGFCDWGERMEP